MIKFHTTPNIINTITEFAIGWFYYIITLGKLNDIVPMKWDRQNLHNVEDFSEIALLKHLSLNG